MPLYFDVYIAAAACHFFFMLCCAAILSDMRHLMLYVAVARLRRRRSVASPRLFLSQARLPLLAMIRLR